MNAQEVWEDRILPRVSRRSDGCWIWTGSLTPYGYGRVGVEYRRPAAHRIAFEAASGRPIPLGMCVLHRCDVRACVNPDHLWLGTKADNNLDKKLKGRGTRGETVPSSKLTCCEVLEIRARSRLGESNRLLGRIFGVSPPQISKIVTRRHWAWLTCQEGG